MKKSLCPGFRSSHQKCCIKKSALQNFAKFTGNTCARESLLQAWGKNFAKLFAKFWRTPLSQNISGRLLPRVFSKICSPSQPKAGERVEDHEGSIKITIGSVIGSINRFCCCKSKEFLARYMFNEEDFYRVQFVCMLYFLCSF